MALRITQATPNEIECSGASSHGLYQVNLPTDSAQCSWKKKLPAAAPIAKIAVGIAAILVQEKTENKRKTKPPAQSHGTNIMSSIAVPMPSIQTSGEMPRNNSLLIR
jgi:hypothetical protein